MVGYLVLLINIGPDHRYRKINRLLKVCYVPTTSTTFLAFFIFFLLWTLTALMKQTRQAVRAVKQSILLRCLWPRKMFARVQCYKTFCKHNKFCAILC
jgi:hypothetical protein